jgi:hypothetical protein
MVLQEQERRKPFCEKHMIEKLSVEPSDPKKPMIFQAMLNQGYKRGR